MEHFKGAQSEYCEDATGNSSSVVLQSPVVTKTVLTDELTAETERLKQMVTYFESEKEIIVAEKSILESANTTYELEVLDMQAEVADLPTMLKVATKKTDEERMKL